ncbi:MAG: polymer-forming cytoskeletal protein [Proteobacteria bacterium]|nr:polymer-forming cytoskeletal protein [Pseudomonadota bacterium]
MKYNKEFKTTSFISDSCELRGNLYTRGGIRIDGKVSGLLNCGSTIYVGETADIEAEIVTRSLVSGGSITGDITAEDTVQINKPGSIRGEIKTCNLGIEKDVYFNGKCQLLSPKNNKRPKSIKPRIPRRAIPNREE